MRGGDRSGRPYGIRCGRARLGEPVDELSPKLGLHREYAHRSRVLEARPRLLEGLVDEVHGARARGLIDSGARAAEGNLFLRHPERPDLLRRQIRHVVGGGAQTQLGAVQARGGDTKGIHQRLNRHGRHLT